MGGAMKNGTGKGSMMIATGRTVLARMGTAGAILTGAVVAMVYKERGDMTEGTAAAKEEAASGAAAKIGATRTTIGAAGMAETTAKAVVITGSGKVKISRPCFLLSRTFTHPPIGRTFTHPRIGHTY